MNFLLSDDQLAFLSATGDLLRDRCDPQRVHRIFDVEGDAQFDADLWAGLVELGLPAIFVPEAYGGLGLDMVDLAIVAERLGAYAAPVPWLGHTLAIVAITLAKQRHAKGRLAA
ncbi:acyl-CoA dehydrogenase family protein [Sphingopyxis sp. PET50]|uniref:acyl-CoA dehydrogenase family protein n=1 Tax=Sphingopyxis sp. PET50 TaxID=2976533 RepID=UPI0021B02033|nr:acyl-CoA dehydrogenase family protein [Sphingopyxis sp. PET50]